MRLSVRLPMIEVRRMLCKEAFWGQKESLVGNRMRGVWCSSRPLRLLMGPTIESDYTHCSCCSISHQTTYEDEDIHTPLGQVKLFYLALREDNHLDFFSAPTAGVDRTWRLFFFDPIVRSSRRYAWAMTSCHDIQCCIIILKVFKLVCVGVCGEEWGVEGESGWMSDTVSKCVSDMECISKKLAQDYKKLTIPHSIEMTQGLQVRHRIWRWV